MCAGRSHHYGRPMPHLFATRKRKPGQDWQTATCSWCGRKEKS